jgi:hypothetical protein
MNLDLNQTTDTPDTEPQVRKSRTPNLRKAASAQPFAVPPAADPPKCDANRRDLQCPVHVDTRRSPMAQLRKLRSFNSADED